MNLKPLAGLVCVVAVAATLAPAPAAGTLVSRTVLCDEFGYIT